MAGRELEVSTGDFLALLPEVFAYFSPSRMVVPSFSLDISVLRSSSLGLNCFPCQVGKASHPEVALVHRIGVSIRHPPGVGVGDFVSFGPSMCRGPTYGERATSLSDCLFKVGYGISYCLTRQQPIRLKSFVCSRGVGEDGVSHPHLLSPS